MDPEYVMLEYHQNLPSPNQDLVMHSKIFRWLYSITQFCGGNTQFCGGNTQFVGGYTQFCGCYTKFSWRFCSTLNLPLNIGKSLLKSPRTSRHILYLTVAPIKSNGLTTIGVPHQNIRCLHSINMLSFSKIDPWAYQHLFLFYQLNWYNFITKPYVPPPIAALDKVGRSNELRRNGVTTKLVVTPA